MTKERKIEILKDLLIQLSDSANILCTSEADERCEVVEECIKILDQQPSNEDVQRVVDYLLRPISKPPTTSKDCVSLGVYKQVVCERDTAIEQLKELGYELGEKIRTSEDCVSREQAKMDVIPNSLYTSEQVIALLDNLSPVTPTHGTCKECKYSNGRYIRRKGQIDQNMYCRCEKYHCEFRKLNFYCADFEKRGNENEVD